MGCDGVGICLPDTGNTHLRVYALDFPFKDQSVQEESLVPIDENVSGTVFRTGKLWCGSVQEARRLGMKDPAQAEVGTVCILPLVSRGRVLGIFGVVKYQDDAFTSDNVLEETERQQILKALKECNWVVAGPKGAAAHLGMKRTTLQQRIRRLGIPRRSA